MRLRREVRSARKPSGIPAIPYTTANAVPSSKLTCVSLMPSSPRMGSTSRLNTCRSVYDRTAVAIRIATTVQAYERLGYASTAALEFEIQIGSDGAGLVRG